MPKGRLVCAYCQAVINDDYEITDGCDSHGICDECLARIMSEDPQDQEWIRHVVEEARRKRQGEYDDPIG